MDINLELVKRIISSDELCDKVNSAEYRSEYMRQIDSYVLSLCDDVSSINLNIEYINRYLRKFVINYSDKESAFFNIILLKVYSHNIRNIQFEDILRDFDFINVKTFFKEKYERIIFNNISVNGAEVVKMLTFYRYVCFDVMFSRKHIDFFVYNLISKNISLSFDLICYFYKIFCIVFASEKNINVSFEISDCVFDNYLNFDNKKKVVIFKNNIKNIVDYVVLSDIFYQIKYLYLFDKVSKPCISYSYDDLKMVKELCLISILGNEYYNKNYYDISFSAYLKKESANSIISYFKFLNLNVDISFSFDSLSISHDIDDNSDSPISIDILFDLVLNKENPNLINGFIRKYPILSCEYRRGKRKSLFSLLLDIYDNNKLFKNLNKDMEWHKSKLGGIDDEIVNLKIERLRDKVSVCVSCINVMNLCINSSDMLMDDIIRSISDLITYSTIDLNVRNDIYLILSVVIPKKISRLCSNRSFGYKENFKKKIIGCYLDSMGLLRSNFDSEYFMKIYSTLEICTRAVDVD